MTLDRSSAVRNAVAISGLSPERVAHMASEYPADLLTPPGDRGRFAAICRADRVVANKGLLTETSIAAVRRYDGVPP
jgi:N-acetylglucosamine-6-phosphate deacetylase